jgi:hypothetical protein
MPRAPAEKAIREDEKGRGLMAEITLNRDGGHGNSGNIVAECWH